MKIAIVGLGKMGFQIAEKLIAAGHQVIGLDPVPETVAKAQTVGVIPAAGKGEVVPLFADERIIIWLMIPSQFVDAELTEWLHLLPANSIIIDGGNSDFRHSLRRAEQATSQQIHFVDVGTSGGIHGIDNGFSMMVGGDAAVVASIEPILTVLAQPHGGWRQVGPAGAGHYVKMVHNAIEYGVMESLAEGYHLLRDGPFTGLNLGDIGDLWQANSIIASNLNGLSAAVLKANPELADIEGVVAESGEARWAIEVAKEHDIKLPDIEAALAVRVESAQGNITFATKLLAAMRNAFGGHNINGQ